MGKDILFYDYQPKNHDPFTTEEVERLLTHNASSEPNNPERKTQLSLFEADKSSYSKLFQIKMDMELNSAPKKARGRLFGQGANNVPVLSVELPSGLPFSLKSDGGVFVLSMPENVNSLTREQVLELKDFLYFQGLADIDTSMLDKALKEQFEAAGERNGEVKGGYDNWFNKVSSLKMSLFEGKEQKPDFDKVLSNVHNNINKTGRVAGESYTMHYGMGKDVTFYLYKGKKESGDGKAPEFTMRVHLKKIKGEWTLIIAFSTPDGAKLTDWQAEKIVEAIKEAGYKEFDVSGVANDDNKAILRNFGGKEGLVPTGVTINEEHYKTMMKLAESKISKEKGDEYNTLEFKKRLIKQMRINKNINRNRDIIEQGEGSEWFMRFSDDEFSGRYFRDIQKENATGDASRAAAASEAAAYLMDELFYNDLLTGQMDKDGNKVSGIGLLDKEAVEKANFDREFGKGQTKEKLDARNEKKFKEGAEYFDKVDKILKKYSSNITARDMKEDDLYAIYEAVKERKIIEFDRKYEKAYEGPGGPRNAVALMGQFTRNASSGIRNATTRVEKKYEVGFRVVEAKSGEYIGEHGQGDKALTAYKNSKGERRNDDEDDDYTKEQKKSDKLSKDRLKILEDKIESLSDENKRLYKENSKLDSSLRTTSNDLRSTKSDLNYTKDVLKGKRER